MLFKYADIAIINKIDLKDILDVDRKEMIRDAEKINPKLKIFTTCALTGENIAEVMNELIN